MTGFIVFLALVASLVASYFAWVIYAAFHIVLKDPNFGLSGDVPDRDSLAEEGWELTHTAEDNNQYLCAEVYNSKTESGYRVILSHTDNPPRLEEDYHFDSYEEAIEMADDWGCSDEDD